MHKIFFFSNTIFELKNVKGGSNTLKATGVVRRIDDLGRIVIPKEIRRTLHIKEGDPLEIFTDKEGEVILKKSLSPELEKVMENKEIYTSKENNELSLPITQNDNNERRYNSQVIYPIISDGDVIGSVILLSKEQNTKMGDTELKVVQSAAGFLSSQMNV